MWKTVLLVVLFVAGGCLITLASYVGVIFVQYELTGVVVGVTDKPHASGFPLFIMLAYFACLFPYLLFVGRLLGLNPAQIFSLEGEGPVIKYIIISGCLAILSTFVVDDIAVGSLRFLGVPIMQGSDKFPLSLVVVFNCIYFQSGIRAICVRHSESPEPASES